MRFSSMLFILFILKSFWSQYFAHWISVRAKIKLYAVLYIADGSDFRGLCYSLH